MMQRRFAQEINDLRGLINEWSPLLCQTDSVETAPKVLLAVSGGIDSMCMADLFATLEEPLPFAIAHCNFHLRGEESDGDEALVRKWADEHEVICHVKDFDTEKYAGENGISIEMAARDLRYAWFADLCREYGYFATVLAHNANDNAETLILNLLRGAGLQGLVGMSVISRHDYLFRPLLPFTRKQIEGYVFTHRVPYRNDSTNAQSEYKRNRIRNEVFPIFSKINPSFIRTLNKNMEYFAEARDVVEDWCASVVPSVVTVLPSDGTGICPCIRISVPALLSHNRWRYLLYHILEPYGFNSSVLASLEELLTSSRTISGKRFESHDYVVYAGREELMVERSLSSEDDDVLTVCGEGTYSFGQVSFEIEHVRLQSDMPLKQPYGTIVFAADKLGFPFILRRWKTGDWMIPFGMKGKKKVSDMFADLKYDVFQKRNTVIVAVDPECSHVAGIAGVRIDNGFRITENTESIIRIRLI